MPQSYQQPRSDTRWIPYLGFALTLAGMIFQGGVLSNRVANNTDRIAKIEALQNTVTSTLGDMNARSARNEAKLDLLLQQALEDRKGQR